MADQPKKPVSGRPTKAGIAAACAAALLICSPLVAMFEGKRNVTYLDIVKVPTACYGHTGADVKIGARYTDAQCDAILGEDLRKHMEPVLACTPGLVDHPNALAAATSLTFNIGATAYCRSTAARRFNAGDIKGGCNAFLSWKYAGGKVVPGLQRRREAERKLCLSS